MVTGSTPWWKRSWQALPLWGIFVVLVVIGLPLSLLFGDSDGSRSLGSAIADSTLSAVGFTAALGVIRWRERRAVMSDVAPSNQGLLYEALRTGRVPDDPRLREPFAMLISRRRRQGRFWVRVNVWFFGGLAVAALLVGVLSGDRPSLVIPVLFAAMAGLFALGGRRVGRRLDGIEATPREPRGGRDR